MKTAATLTLVSLAFIMSGCNATLEKINKDLETLNAALSAGLPTQAGSQSVPPTLARPSQGEQAIQLVLTNHQATNTAIEAAAPVIKASLSIHQCISHDRGLLFLNKYAMPGVNMVPIWAPSGYPNNSVHLRYHDYNKCVDIRAADQFSMPALNALNFRVVYFASDSGETVNFFFKMRRVDNGSWLFAAPPGLH